MKKILVFLLATVMAFSFVACGGGADTNSPEGAVREWFEAMYQDFDVESAYALTIQCNKDLIKYLNDAENADEWESKTKRTKEQIDSRISSMKEMLTTTGSFTLDKVELVEVYQTQGDYVSAVKRAELDDFYKNIDAIAEISVTATLYTSDYTDTDEDIVYAARINGKWYLSFN